jgi:antitoxin HicB
LESSEFEDCYEKRSSAGGHIADIVLYAGTRIRSSLMNESLSFSVVLEPQEDGGFTVVVPALPEVVTEGDTEEEALANAHEAIRAILSYRRDHGIAIPADARPKIRRVTVAA